MPITKLTGLSSQSLSRRLASCEFGELCAASAASQGDEDFDMRVPPLQLGYGTKTARLAVDVLVEIGPVVEKLPMRIVSGSQT